MSADSITLLLQFPLKPSNRLHVLHTHIYLIFPFRNFSISSRNCESRISFDSLYSAFIHTYKNQFRTQIFHLHLFISFYQWISQFTLNSSLNFSGSSFFLQKNKNIYKFFLAFMIPYSYISLSISADSIS